MADRVFSYEFRGQFTNLTAGLTAAGKSVSDLGDKMTALDRQGAQYRRGLTTVGDAAGKMGLAAAGGLALATKAAVDWESQWAGVLKTVDGTASEMSALEDELRGLARTMPATHKEIAATAEAAGQLGVRRQDVTEFTKTMLQLGETTNLTADEAATSFARFANIMGTPTSEVERMGASVVGLGNNFATTEAEVVALSTRLAAAGRQAGLTEADVFGIAAALTSVGVEAEAGGTAMSKVFTSIGDAARSGDEKLQVFADVAGVTADEFQRIFENNPSEAIGQFVEGMGGIAREGGNTSAIFKDLGLTDQRLMRAILSVGSATGSWAEATGLANDEYEKNSALTDEFAKRAETSGAKATVALNNIRDAGIDLGDELLPAFAKGAEGIATMAQAFGNLPGPAKTATTGLLGITAVLGGGLWFTSKVVNGIATAKGALVDLGIAADGTAGSLGRVAKTAGTLAAFAAIGAGIGAGIAEMTGANLELEDLARNLEAVGKGVENQALGQIADDLKIVSDRGLRDGIGETATEILSLNGVFGTFKTTLDGAQSDLEAVDQELARLVESGRGEEAAAMIEPIAAAFYDLPAGASVGQEAIDGVVDKFGSYKTALENTATSSDDVASQGEAVAGAIGEVGGAAGEAAEDVDTLADALSALLSPQMSLASATDAWAAGLRNIKEGLAKGTKSLEGNTDAADKNRAALRGQVSNLLSLVSAQADTGAGAKQLEGQMRRGYAAIIDAGKAAGMSEDQMRDYLKTLGLTPKDITTIVKAMTADAENDVTRTQGKVDKLGNTTAIPKVALNTGSALGDIQNVYNALTNLNGKTAMTYIVTKRTVTGGGMGPVGSADGSTVPKDGGAYADRYHYLLAPGEEVISNRRGQADRWRPLLKAINAGRLADGGTVRGLANGGTAGPNSQLFGLNSNWLSAAELGVRIASLSQRQIAQIGDDMERLGKGPLSKLSKAFDKATVVREREVDAAKEYAKAQRDILKDLRATSLEMRNAVAENFRAAGLGSSVDLLEAARTGAVQIDWAAVSDLATRNGMSDASTEEQVRAYLASLSSSQTAALEVQAQYGLAGQQTRDAKQFEALLSQLTGLGLDGALFNQISMSGNIGQAQYLATLGVDEIDAYEQRFKANRQAARSTGSFAADAAFRADIRQQTKNMHEAVGEYREANTELKEQTKLARQLVNRLERLEKQAEQAPKKTGKAVGDEIKNEVSAGRRSAT